MNVRLSSSLTFGSQSHTITLAAQFQVAPQEPSKGESMVNTSHRVQGTTRIPLGLLLGFVAVLAAFVSSPVANASVGGDLLKAANGGPAPEETSVNVPGKTVRIRVGVIDAATWLGKPIWNVDGDIKFGPLRLMIGGTPIEWSVADAHCLGEDKGLEKSTDPNIDYDKANGGNIETRHWPIILEFVLPNDPRLYGQTVTADLAMHVAYLGRQGRPYMPPVTSSMNATMQTPVSIKIASVEEAKHYNSFLDSDFIHGAFFYIVTIGCFLFLLAVANFLWGKKR
jgi:hypothetical protein